jgi:hypothetical protein
MSSQSETKIGMKYNRPPAQSSSRKEKFQVKADIFRCDGKTLIEADVDIKALRRFSLAAKEVLPGANVTDQKPTENLKFEIHLVGYNEPLDHALEGLLAWMEREKHQDHSAQIDVTTIKVDDSKKILLGINILASCLAFRVPISTRLIEDQMRADIRSRPITAEELSAL